MGQGLVEAAKGGDAFLDVLDDGDRGDVGGQLVEVPEPVGGSVRRRCREEVARRESEYGVEYVRLGAGDEGDDELKVAIRVGNVELWQYRLVSSAELAVKLGCDPLKLLTQMATSSR